jgi:NAD+ synthase (glutamine-hydrolysing)
MELDWSSHGFVRVAAVSPPVVLGDPLANAAVIADKAAELDALGTSIIAFPELSLTGYTCEDLFLTDGLRIKTEAALADLCVKTANLATVLVVGAPLLLNDGRRVNAAVIIHGGRVVGAVPKQHLPNNGEFYERRWFTPGFGINEECRINAMAPFPISTELLVRFGGVTLGVEICEDLWSPDPPSTALALSGANVIVNPSASNELVAKVDYRRELVRQQSARTHVAYLYAGASPWESTKDIVFGGHTLIAENGTMLSEGERFSFECALTISDIDVTRLANERARDITWSTAPRTAATTVVDLTMPARPLPDLRRVVVRNPFVPDDPATRDERANEILAIQSVGLARRLHAARADKAVIGVSGGLDSTLALLVCVEAMQRLSRPVDSIVGITMPGLGTTVRTHTAADDLMALLGVTSRTIPIGPAVAQHFTDISHDPKDHSVVFENAQARERTQILFDVANQVGGIVVGTGDLSEMALGWCTFNADHMSNYGVNASVPKSLVRHLVRWYADHRSTNLLLSKVLHDVADTPVSPELLPPDAAGNIVQETEDVIGPYELHDFFLFHYLRNGASKEKICALATHAYADTYDDVTVTKWLDTFWRRFHSQQFKRTTLPPGPKVGSVSISPRGDLRLPDELAY